METEPYLIFNFRGSLYGVDARLVHEIFHLPAITPFVEAPRHILGVINLRGKILPIVNLDLRLGISPQVYGINDSIIVLRSAEQLVGMVVNEVREVKLISPDVIESKIQYKSFHSAGDRCLVGIAKVDSEIITLLDSNNLLGDFASNAFAVNGLPDETALQQRYANEALIHPPTSQSFIQVTPAEELVLQERANNLRQSSEDSQDFAGLMPLAVVGLNNEYFGLRLDVVQEFTDVRKITPIPCCPSHIVGNMNLRGEIITLIDVRGVLNLPSSSVEAAPKTMIVRAEEIVAGIMIDEVLDVTYLHPTDLKPVPTAVRGSKSEYLTGTATYQDKVMGILDISKLLLKGELVVNEEL